VVPYVRVGRHKVLLLVVKDRLHDEWTFVSGGCKNYETDEQSAARELKEETRAVVQVDMSACEYVKFAMYSDYKEPSEQLSTHTVTHYSVYLVDITSYKSIPAIVRAFRRRSGCVRGVYDETNDIQFVSLWAFARRPNVWPFIRDVVMRDPAFCYHCRRLVGAQARQQDCLFTKPIQHTTPPSPWTRPGCSNATASTQPRSLQSVS
jgi:8-oxo-dGTP pyrophosphatase MutT (NUDIX family)